MNPETGNLDAFRAFGHGMWRTLHALADHAGSLDRTNAADQESGVRDLLARYAYYYDGDNVDRLASIFHEDCVLTNPRGTYVGRPAIVANYTYLIGRRRLSMHYITNILVRLMPDGTAHAGSCWYVIEVDRDGNVSGAGGTYLDQAVKDGTEGWQLVARRITTNFTHSLPTSTASPSDNPPRPTAAETSRDWTGD